MDANPARVRRDALPAGGPEATDRALAAAENARAIVLVEGFSDQIALETLASRYGRELTAEGVAVVPIGGAQALGRFLARFGGTRLAGLYDAGEEAAIRSRLEQAGFGPGLTRAAIEELGFFVCVDDLEDELIRAHGAQAVERILEAQDDLGSFRTFQKQPAWRGRPVEAQLHRFMGSADRRKLHYARILVETLELARVPRPLAGVLAHVAQPRVTNRIDA